MKCQNETVTIELKNGKTKDLFIYLRCFSLLPMHTRLLCPSFAHIHRLSHCDRLSVYAVVLSLTVI